MCLSLVNGDKLLAGKMIHIYTVFHQQVMSQ